MEAEWVVVEVRMEGEEGEDGVDGVEKVKRIV